MSLRKILIADDNRLIRRGVAKLLATEPAWEVCGEATDGSEAVQKARELRPDLILLDISMPGMSGFEAAHLLRREVPETKILIMSQHDPAQMARSSIASDADAWLDKSRIAGDLLRTIRNLLS